MRMWKLTPFKIALIYVLFGVVWITSSDLLVETITTDPRLITKLSLIKGWLFMAITATVLYGLVRRYAWERTRSEAAVGSSEKKYRTLIETTGTGFVILDAEGRVLDANEEYVCLAGRSVPQEIRGRSVTEWTAEHDRERNSREVRKCLEQGFVRNLEVDYVHRSGAIVPVEITATVIEQNGAKQVLSLVRDISERKKTQVERLLSKQRFHAIFNNTPLGICIVDMNRRPVDANAAFQTMLGYTLDELKALSVPDISDPGDDQRTRSLYRAMLEGSISSFTMEKRYRRKDGSPLWTNLTGTLIRNEKNEPEYSIGIVEDITVRKQAEQALRDSESRLKEAQEIAHVGNWEWDLATNRVFWSDELFRIYGFAPGEIAPDYGVVVNAMHPDSRPKFLAAIDAALAGERSFEMDYAFFRKDGAEAVLHTIGKVQLDAAGKPARMTGIVQDITQQKRAQDALLESEERFRSIFDGASDGILIADRSTRQFTDANRAMCEMLGYSRDELLSIGIDRIHPADDLQRVLAEFEKQVRGEKRIAEDLPVLRKDCTVFYADISTTTAVIGGRQYAIGIFRDITERRIMREALRSSRDFIDRILDTVDEAFIVIDRDYRIVMANNAYAAQAGLPLQDILGKHCHEISHGSSMPCFENGEECGVRRCCETGEPQTCVHKHTAKDGGVLYVETKAYPLKDADGAVTSAIEVINNITDRHLLEEQMLKTQKLEAVGLLAGGIAHDFNNLLQAVFGNISLAKMFSDKDGKAYGMLEDAEAALYQATHLTKQLLTFSKGGEPVKRMVAPAVLVEQAARFALSGSNVGSRVSKDPDLWTVEADEGQLNQVIHNIVLNASEAMPDGGAISLDMQNVVLSEKSGVPLPKGKYVRIGITDTGAGIPEQHISRIFDPYFTTKKKGSGLGLATSYSIIAKHGGTITVSSVPGDGTTFFLYLPASDRRHVPAKAGAAKPISGKGKVLVMDDEEVVRTVASLMVSSLGYTIEVAENGDQAVERYVSAMRSSSPFDAVILDLTVRGGMGGKETAAMISAIDPAVRAVVSSGYSDDAVVAHYREYGFSAVLSKPYQVEELGRVLQEVLRK
jgi:PAS domain S-box-containing protein